MMFIIIMTFKIIMLGQSLESCRYYSELKSQNFNELNEITKDCYKTLKWVIE